MRLTVTSAPPLGLKNISDELHLCQPMKDAKDLDWMLRWSRNAFVMMGMMDYPYASAFMGNLPANPVNVSCDKAIEFGITNPLAGLREAIGVFYGDGSGRSSSGLRISRIVPR